MIEILYLQNHSSESSHYMIKLSKFLYFWDNFTYHNYMIRILYFQDNVIWLQYCFSGTILHKNYIITILYFCGYIFTIFYNVIPSVSSHTVVPQGGAPETWGCRHSQQHTLLWQRQTTSWSCTYTASPGNNLSTL